MKKFASVKVFRNVIFLLLFIQPAGYILSQNIPQTFQTPLKKCWEIEDRSIESLASDNNSLIISNDIGEIKNINKKNGEEIWKTSIGSKNEAIVTFNNDETFLIILESQTNGKKNLVLKTIDEQTGIVKESNEIAETDERITRINLRNLFSKNQNIHVGYLTLIFQHIDLFLKNSKAAREDITLSSAENYFSISDGRNILYKSLNDENQFREIKLSTDIENEKVTAAILTDDSLFFGNESGKVFQKNFNLDKHSKILRTGSRISSIQMDKANLLITSNDNFLYDYSLSKKKIKWKKRLSGRVSINPGIGDNFAVVATSAVPELLFIDLENGKTFNQISMPDDVFIKDYQIDGESVFILTSNGLVRFTQNC